MSDDLKRLLGKTALRIAKRLCPEELGALANEASVPHNRHDYQTLGLTDAVKSGWYLSNTAELVEGMKILPDDVVLDVGCGDGLATHFCARNGAHVAFTHIEPAKVEKVRQ